MFSNPKTIVDRLGITPGMVVVDLGSGSGEYSLALSRAVGHSGKVYAVDVQKDLLTKLKNQATSEGLMNIEVIWGDAEKSEGTGLSNGFADLCLVANVLFQVEDGSSFIREASRLLKDKGRLVLVDWTDSFGGLGPRPEAVISPERAEEMLQAVGFKKSGQIKAGDHHYGLIFEKI